MNSYERIYNLLIEVGQPVSRQRALPVPSQVQTRFLGGQARKLERPNPEAQRRTRTALGITPVIPGSEGGIAKSSPETSTETSTEGGIAKSRPSTRTLKKRPFPGYVTRGRTNPQTKA